MSRRIFKGVSKKPKVVREGVPRRAASCQV